MSTIPDPAFDIALTQLGSSRGGSEANLPVPVRSGARSMAAFAGLCAMGKYKFKARAFVGKTPNDHRHGWETAAPRSQPVNN